MKSRVKKIIPKKGLLMYHKALALFARAIYQNPSKKMTVIGVTGTDGKTSSVILISEMLDAAGKVNAYMTTAEFKIADKKWTNETKQTMPGRFRLQKLLQDAVRAGCTHVIVETSSQGIEQFRHLGIDYDVALFTNLSEDHLEAHGSFENYRYEKIKLFQKVASDKRKVNIPKVHVVNTADPEAAAFAEVGGVDRTIGFMIEGDHTHVAHAEDTFIASKVAQSGDGTSFLVQEASGADQREYTVDTSLIGRFNVYNMLGAAAVVRSVGISETFIQKALSEMKGIPGRLELIGEGQDFTVIVDYAHAENALRKVFEVVKPLSKGKIISVLGSCGGGRDVKKRPILGKIAAENADIVIVTNEDPYDEDPEKIISQVAGGARKEGKIEDESLFIVPERRDAIELALKKAKTGDIVLLTGKGSEQCIMGKSGEKIPWDDRKVAKELIHEQNVS